MAASMRLRLHFDGSVCTHISPRKCWFLVNLDNCNVVADLEYLIRERFEVDRSLRINLYMDDFLLPPMEKIHVVRDNDTLWVHLTEIEDHLQRFSRSITSRSDVVGEEGKDDSFSEEEQDALTKRTQNSTRKNGTHEKDLERTPNEINHELSKLKKHKNTDDVEEKIQSGRKKSVKKKRKIKKVDRFQQSNQNDSFCSMKGGDDDDGQIEHQRSSKTSNKRLKMSNECSTSHTSLSKASGSRKKLKRAKKHLRDGCEATSEKEHRRVESHLSSVHPQSASEKPNIEIDEQPITSVQSIFPGISHESNTDGNVPHTTETDNGSAVSKSRTAQSCEDHHDSSKLGSVKVRTLNPVHLSSGHIRFESSSGTDSDSSSSEDLNGMEDHIEKEETNGKQSTVVKTIACLLEETFTAVDKMANETNTAEKSTSSNPGEKVPENQPPHEEEMLGNKGVATGNSDSRGRKAFRGRRRNWDKKSQLEDKQSNKSVVVQNGPMEPESPPKDFPSFPALVGPPRQGDIIAYKILELSESYCPQLSDYKEAKVLHVNTATGQIEAELCMDSMTKRPVKLGKFDLPWSENERANMECADESNTDLQVHLQLQDLVDPRLVPSTVA